MSVVHYRGQIKLNPLLKICLLNITEQSEQNQMFGMIEKTWTIRNIFEQQFSELE